MDYLTAAGEWAGSFETPPQMYHHPVLRVVRTLAYEATLYCNDLYSVEKEAARGDVTNTVLFVERDRGCSRHAALEAVAAMIMQRLAEFQRIKTSLPDLYEVHQLTGADRTATDQHVLALEAWIRGNHDFEVRSSRYTPESVLTQGRPNYLDDLL